MSAKLIIRVLALIIVFIASVSIMIFIVVKFDNIDFQQTWMPWFFIIMGLYYTIFSAISIWKLLKDKPIDFS